MDRLKKQALEDLKKSIANSIAEKYENDTLSIMSLDVMAKAKAFSSLHINSRDLFEMLVETITELEAIKFALSSYQSSFTESVNLINKYREVEVEVDSFCELAMDAIYSASNDIKELRKELGKAPKKLASSGGKGKAQRYEPLRQRAIELYESRKWNSAREAAQKMESEIIALSKKIGVPLSGFQPWETIHKWILKHTKK